MTTNAGQIDLQPLEILFFKFFHILQRPLVLGQLSLFLLCLLIAWGGNYYFWLRLGKKVSHYQKLIFSNYHQSAFAKYCRFIYFFLTPTLAVILVSITNFIYFKFIPHNGLIESGLLLTILFFFYRLFLYLLSIVFSAGQIRYYRNHLFNPLLFYILFINLINLIGDYKTFFQTPLVILFDTPVSIGAIFLVTIGFYWWVIATSLFEKLIIYVFVNYNSHSDKESIKAISVLVRYSLIGLGIVCVFGYIGVNPAVLATITGGLSVGIGFGLKEVISNFVSGIWLFIEGSLKPGDVIQVSGDLSQVVELGFRAATVNVIRDNSERIIPNQVFFTEEVNTYTRSNRLVYRSIAVGASYGTNPQKVLTVLKQVGDRHPHVLRNPEPAVFFLGFGDSSLDFELKFWLDDPLIGKRVTSEIGCAIWQAFAKAGIEIPFPQRDVHLKSDSSMELTGVTIQNTDSQERQ